MEIKPNEINAEYDIEMDIAASHFPSSASKNICIDKELLATAYGYEFQNIFSVSVILRGISPHTQPLSVDLQKEF